MDAAAQVEDAVRRYFESGERGLAGGLLRVWDESMLAAGLEPPHTTVIRSMTVVSAGSDEADVDLDAVQSFELRTERGRVKRVSTSIAGPVSARRERGRWRVEDHCIDGRSISKSFFPVSGDAVVVDGLSLRLRSVMLGRRNVFAFVEVENDRAAAATIGRVLLRAKRCSCFGGRTREQVESGASTFALGWRKWLPLDTRELRVELDLRIGRRQYEVTWLVDLHERRTQASGRPVAPLRALMQSRWVARPLAILPWTLIVAIVPLFGVPPLQLVSFFGLLMAYVYLHPMLQGRWRG